MQQPAGFSYLPVVVKNLLIINLIMFLLKYVLKNTSQLEIEQYLGLFYFKSEYFKPYQFFTHLFMHGSFGHLFSNMFALWMFGTALENFWGAKKFLIYYFATGLGAAFLHTMVIFIDLREFENALSIYLSSPSYNSFEVFVLGSVPGVYKPQFLQMLEAWSANQLSTEYLSSSISLANELKTALFDIPTVGASGAVFGVLLAFGMLFPNSLIYVFFAIPLKAKYFVMLYGLFELYSGFANNPNDNVAHFAHLGGMLFGFILIKFWNRNQFNRFG